jgi:hypothetical protein
MSTEKLLYERLKVAVPRALADQGWIDEPGGMEWKHGGKKRVQELTDELWKLLAGDDPKARRNRS